MAGQRKGGELRLFLIYTAGTFIEAGEDTPYMQIGEHKYGKPILDRVIRPDTTIEEAVKAALVSMDLDAALQPFGGHAARPVRDPGERVQGAESQRIESDHKEFRQISDSWAQALRQAFHDLPA